MPSLDAPVKSAVGAAERVLGKSFGIRTIGDLLRNFPRRYEKRGELTDLGALRPGEEVTIQARVESMKGRQIRAKLHKLDVKVSDKSGRALTLTFFNSAWRQKQLQVGKSAFFSGTVGEFKGVAQLTNPVVELDDGDPSDIAGALVPIYGAVKGFQSWKMRKAVRIALDVADFGDDPIPVDIRGEHRLLDRAAAYNGIHRPTSWPEIGSARKRLKWDEAFLLQVALGQRRWAARARPARPRHARPDGLQAAFDVALPFTLTEGQQAIGAELAADLAGVHPMHRLLQGEVGSGKTVVALRAMLQVIDSGGQAALLAPTEVLAQQHSRSISELLGPLVGAGQLGSAEDATTICLLTGSLSAANRRTALADAASGAAGIVIGTHALLEEQVEFADLGLVVIDEQHRFGVEQREALRAKGDAPPHLLVMTATPIPRTVAMTVYGDLDVSTLTELPAGRAGVTTSVVPVSEKPAWLDRAWTRIREEAAAGHQAFVVCPRIGGGETDDDLPVDPTPADDGLGELEVDRVPRRPAAAVAEVYPMLTAGPLDGLRVEQLHGRLPPDTKDDVMRRFARGEIDVLVATTVIEVGVDVPNATAMVVLDADRFGVSQLHQLRGRVARGSAPGVCLLVTDSPPESPARERLDAVAATLDGFVLSELDLAQRREGDVLGATQAGRRRTVRMLSVLHDAELIRAARDASTRVIDSDPALAEHPALAAALTEFLEPEQADYLEKA